MTCGEEPEASEGGSENVRTPLAFETNALIWADALTELTNMISR